MNISQATNASISYEGRPTEVSQSILYQVLSSGNQEKNTNHNIDLILWIYEKEEWREELLGGCKF